MGCHFLLQGICPTQGSNLGLLHCKQILYHLSLQGNPYFPLILPSTSKNPNLCLYALYLSPFIHFSLSFSICQDSVGC